MSEPVWSHGRRIAFRFGVVAGVLYLLPFFGGFLPKTEWLEFPFKR